MERPLPVERYGTEGDLLTAIYETLDGGEAWPKLAKFPKEEFGILAVRNDVGLYGILDLSWLGMGYIAKLKNGYEYELGKIWNDVLRVAASERVIAWRGIPNGQNKVLQGVMARPGAAYHKIVNKAYGDWWHTIGLVKMLGNADYAGERNYIFCSEEMAYALHLDTVIRARRAYSSSKRIVLSKNVWEDRTIYYVRTDANFAAFDFSLNSNGLPSKLNMTTPKPLIRMVKDSNFVSMETRDGGDVVLLSRDETVRSLVFCNFKVSHDEFFERCLRSVSHAEISALERPVACVNVGIGGLSFLTGVHTGDSEQDEVLLMSNVSLEGPSPVHIPLKPNRIYRELDDVDEQVLTVKLVDSFDSSRYPPFFVGYTAITLHFRRTFKNFLRH